MSLLGKASLSIRKQDVQEQKSLALGFKSLMFAHKAVAGETGISLNSLNTPTEMPGFVNPNASDLVSARLFFFRKNLRLISSLRGVLMDYLSYDVANSSQINFNGFTAEEGEIFIGYVDAKPTTVPLVVDGRAVAATGELAIGVTDFPVGTSFQINKYPGQQVGEVLVYRNGQIQARNPDNGTSGGNYQEIDAGNGYGSVIRFNNAPVSQADNIMVVGNGILIERPTGSMMAEIENIAGQLDQVIPTLAALAGVPETDFQAAPNNTDLKQFGDRVVGLEEPGVPGTPKLATTSVDGAVKKNKIQVKTLSGPISSTTADITSLKFNNLVIGKVYRVTLHMASQHNGGSALETIEMTVAHNGVTLIDAEHRFDARPDTIQLETGHSRVFVATATTVIFSVGVIGTLTLLDGTGQTFSQLEELNNYEVTTDFT